MANGFENISWLLGYYLDGWADLVEGMGKHAPGVKLGVINQLNQRLMPDRVKVGETEIKEGFFTDTTRPYVETKTSPGARTLIYVEQHGNDLYASWRSYLRPTINWGLIVKYAIASLILSVIVISIIWIFATVNIVTSAFKMWNSKPFSTAFWTWLGFYTAICFGYIALLVLIYLFGKLIKKDFSNIPDNVFIPILFFVGVIGSFFIKDTGHTMVQEISLLFKNIKQGYLFLAIPFSLIPLAISIFEYLLGIAAIVGLIIRKNLLAFILKEPNIFDADDIIAMNLSVHKSMLRVLDEVGIDNSKLRLKGPFKSGRSGEVV